MASSKKSMASPALLFVAMALMLVACTQAKAPAPAPVPSLGSCPPGFKNSIDLTDSLRSIGRNALTFVDPELVPVVRSVLELVPHTGLNLCICSTAFPIQCVKY